MKDTLKKLMKTTGMALFIGMCLFLFFLLSTLGGSPLIQRVGLALFVGVVLYQVVNDRLRERKEASLYATIRALRQEVVNLRARLLQRPGGKPEAPQPLPLPQPRQEGVSNEILLVLSQVTQQPNFLNVSPAAQEKTLRVYASQLQKPLQPVEKIVQDCLKILKALKAEKVS